MNVYAVHSPVYDSPWIIRKDTPQQAVEWFRTVQDQQHVSAVFVMVASESWK